ncbi:putative nuclease HARBI1 [Euwallacea similis]|uniref:putative nuclease HARBI1 n=1 Tax=Euwallacea similis TaxID=1736056 RepID=UPI003450E2C1
MLLLEDYEENTSLVFISQDSKCLILTSNSVANQYMGDPGFQISVVDSTGVHQSTVSRTIDYVPKIIFEKASDWIKYPNSSEEIVEAKSLWQKSFTFPTVIGAIDCSHITIEKPKLYGNEYVNRKGITSINVQATCNAKEIFRSVDASWPGSVHDSRILKNCNIYPTLVQNNGQMTLLGDSGYALAPWLLTPYRNPQNDEENYYNLQHLKNRVIIERCFGQLKRRFPILGNKIRLQLNKISRIIICGFVLHNITKHFMDPDDFEEPFSDPDNDYNDDSGEEGENIRRKGEEKRNMIAAILFRNRNENLV